MTITGGSISATGVMMSGALSGASGISLDGGVYTGGVTISGLGMITFGNSTTSTIGGSGNSWVSATVGGGSTLDLGSTNALPSGALFFVKGTLAMMGYSTTIAGLSGTAAAAVQNGGSTAATVTIGGSASQSYTGTISDGSTGSLALVQTGSLTTTLNGSTANTYSGGTTVSGGTLNASSNSLGTGAVTVSGGTLGSNGATLNVGGMFSLSLGSVALNTRVGGSGPVTLALASGQNFSMSGGSLNLLLGSTSSEITGSGAGTFAISGSTIALTIGSGFLYSNRYDILNGFASGSVDDLSITGYDTADYTAELDNSGELSFSAVPEPATTALWIGGMALAVAAWRHRRQLAANA